MKKAAIFLLSLLLLAGCSNQPKEIEKGMALRSQILKASECTFETDIAADYGDKTYSFSMNCRADEQGDVFFTVTKPETISGISGSLSGEGGKLMFDDTALHFNLLTDDQVTPVSAPWIFTKTLRSGNLTSACTENGQIRLTMDDRYEEDALQVDIWLNGDGKPEYADILYDGKRILSVAVKNFVIA